jgi:hypothetical protein
MLNISCIPLLNIHCRNFAVTQTKGIHCAIYQKYPSKTDMEEAYTKALQDGYVKVLGYN